MLCYYCGHFFFFYDTATTEIYTLSLHDALPIRERVLGSNIAWLYRFTLSLLKQHPDRRQSLAMKRRRSEEHTSELQSQSNLVCRLLLEKKKTQQANLTAQVQRLRTQQSR